MILPRLYVCSRPQLTKAWHSQKEEIKQLRAQLASAEIKIRQLSGSS